MADDSKPRDLTEAERIKLRTAKAALAGALDRDSDPEGREAAFAQFLQTGSVHRETLDALHVPDDAGEHAEALRAILCRIPEGWGRWISCNRGWYPLVCELDSALAQLDPSYEVHQCKEKFGTLRYYAHSDRYPGVDNAFQALIDAAEERSAAICELCGAPGRLHTRSSPRVKTVCAACAAAGGWELIGETVEELTPDRTGVWTVTAEGVQHYFDLRFGYYSRSDETAREVAAVDLWPRVGDGFRLVLAGGEDGDEWRVAESVTRIERIR